MLSKQVFFLIIAMGLVVSCNQIGGKASEPQEATAPTPEASEGMVLAMMDGDSITEANIEQRVATQLRQARTQLYDVQKAGIDQIIGERLLAKEASERGIAVEELQKNEIGDKIDISDKDIESFYEKQKARLQGKELDEVKGMIHKYLYQQQFLEKQSALLAKLKKKSDIKYFIDPPRVPVESGDYPSQGPEDAPIHIIEFSDYQCPFCARARTAVHRIVEEYGEKVRYVFRDFPLPFHKEAQKAHEAAHCAHEQGKYWKFNDKLFQSQRALTIDDLKRYAKELKLKTKEFEECLESGRYTKMVQDSIRYGQSLGVSGTPAYFINGRMVSGALPFEAFQEIIEDELSRK